MTDVETDPAVLAAQDEALRPLWAMDEPAARDPVFVLAAMARVERRRLMFEVIELFVIGVPVLAILWAAWPTLVAAAPHWPALIALGPTLLCVAAIALVMWSTREAFAIEP
jgi:hypothetical protein